MAGIPRDYDRAIEEAQKGLELDPQSTILQIQLARAYTENGMHEEAVVVAERMVQIDGAEPRALGALAETYARAGRRADALRILEELPAGTIDPRDVAAVHAALGDGDAAFEWIEKAYGDRSFWIIFLDVDPAFASLRADPRFQELLRRLNYPGGS
jgi:tetratricopeptide (TPR) repeat protein